MYLEFYNLKEKPFQITCDPKYLWLGEKHKEALATMLRYGIMDDHGFVLLTGEVGTGKTLLVNKLLTLLPDDTVVGNLSISDFDSIDFCQLLVNCLQFPSPFGSKAEFLIQMNAYLRNCAADSKRVILIIDEAQGLRHPVLEDIRTLSNMELPDKKLLSILLVGQPELNHIILNKENRALAQRITLRYHLDPLDCDETANYIRHRLGMAGSSETIFKENALRKIFGYSAGIPRLINILCDHALLTGFSRNLNKLSSDIIEECARELRIPSQQATPRNLRYTAESPPSSFSSTNSVILNAQRKVPVLTDNTTRPVHGHVYTAQKPRSTKWVPQSVFLLILFFLSLVLMSVIDKTTLLSSRDVSIDPHQRQISEDEVSASGKKGPINTRPASGLRQISEDQLSATGEKGPKNTGPAPILQNQNPSPGMAVLDYAGSPGWPEETNIPIQFDAANQITKQSMAAIDQVAADLAKYPERLVYIHGLADGVGSPEHRVAVWRKRVNSVKSRLIANGASPEQVTLAGIDTTGMKAVAERNATSHAMMELPQHEYSQMYNQDK